LCEKICLHMEIIFSEEWTCELWGTDNVRGQTSEHIFAPNESYCLYIPWKGISTNITVPQIALKTLKQWNISLVAFTYIYLRKIWCDMPWVKDLDLIFTGIFFKFGILLFLLKIIIKFVCNNLMFLVILAFFISFQLF